MNEALNLLDNVLALAHKEKFALETGAYEEAITLAEQRGKLSAMAWNMYNGQDANAYSVRLQEINTLQTQLIKLATDARDKIRMSLNRSRQEKKRIKGYHLAVGQAMQ